MPQFPRTPARPSQADAVWNARVQRVESKLLQAAELIAEKMVETYTDPPAQPEAPVVVRRRAMANVMQIWQRCPQKTCRRRKACLGEPSHCLDGCFPGLPPGQVAAYVASSRRRKKQ